MSIEASVQCTLDSVTLFDGPMCYSPRLGSFCADNASSVISSGPYVFVVFLSDASVNTGRFSMNWTFVDEGCLGRFIWFFGGSKGKQTQARHVKQSFCFLDFLYGFPTIRHTCRLVKNKLEEIVRIAKIDRYIFYYSTIRNNNYPHHFTPHKTVLMFCSSLSNFILNWYVMLPFLGQKVATLTEFV